MYKHKNLQMIFGVTLMSIMGLSLISPALPSIQDAFDLSKTQIGLMITVFTLPGVVVSPLAGFFSDKRGRKGIVLISLLVFALCGGAISFIRDYNAILLLRFFQGAAASGLSTLSMALIGDAYSGQERAAAMGYNGSVLSVGAAVYPVIGGMLASISWYCPFYTFFIAIPIGLCILLYMDIPQNRNSKDYIGYLRLAARQLCNMRFAVLIPVCIVAFIFLYGPYLTYFPLFLDDVFGTSSFNIGVILSFMSIIAGIVSYHSGKIFSRMGSNAPIALGFVIYSLSLLSMYMMKNIYVGIPAVVFYGLAQGMTIPILQTKYLDSVSEETKGIVSALYSSNLRLGQSIGPMLMGLFFMFGGYEAVFALSAVMGLSMAAVVALAMRHGAL